MNTEIFFLEGCKLPKPLPEQEVYELLEKIKQDDEQAKTKLVEHNIRLVLYRVTGRFSTVTYDPQELVAIGNLGLIKAITTYDSSKKVKFATYATRCIDNEILMFLRKSKKYENDDSLDKSINFNNDSDELKLEDTISDDTDIEEEYINNETNLIVRRIVNELPERDKKIIMLHFGFYNDKTYTQQEIAEMLSISRSYVAKLITMIVKRLGKKLEQEGSIELKTKIVHKKEGENKMGKSLQTIYEYFSSYTKEQVDTMLEKLSEEEKALITLRYGEDLHNPISGKLNKEETNKFYGSLIPKMKRLLANPNKETKPRKKRTITTETVINDLVGQTQPQMIVEQTKKETIIEQTNPKTVEIIKQQDRVIITENTSAEQMKKEDYFKILELLRTPSFNQMMSVLSAKESVIISLRLGYIDEKYFSTDSIAEFLGIEEQEVIDTTKKILLLYKENINQFIDNAIQIVTEDSKIALQPFEKTLCK